MEDPLYYAREGFNETIGQIFAASKELMLDWTKDDILAEFQTILNDYEEE